jgi:tripartite-type tricarboxylate transporter receptor subunit TctC
MINAFAAGGRNDVVARLFAQRMGEILGQSVIIENVAGAGGMNGADRVTKAAPDGYTFLLGTASEDRIEDRRAESRSPAATESEFATVGWRQRRFRARTYPNIRPSAAKSLDQL